MTRQFLPPEIDDRYELGHLLGTGASGAVYKALDRASGSNVAVKVLHQPLLTNNARARFEREVAVHARLVDVPGVMRVHAHGVSGQRGWLAMDLYQNTLAERLASAGPMTPAEALPILRACATALGELHQAGVLHRDIKPSNVFLTADERPVLADLGVAHIEGDATLTGMTPLSLQWAAPETIESGDSSVATDLYSLGATAFAMLQGSPPFDLSTGTADDRTIAVGPALRLIASGERPRLRDDVGEPIRSLIDDLLSVNPTDRPTSAEEVVDRLGRPVQVASVEEVVDRLGRLDRPVQVARPGDTRSGRTTRLLLAAAAVVIAIAGWVIAQGGGGDGSGDGSSTATLADQPERAVTVEATTAPPTIAPAATAAPAAPAATAPPTPGANDPSPAQASAPTSGPTTTNTAGAAGECGAGIDWCEPLLLDQWSLQGDPQIVSFDEVDTEFGPAFALSPGPADEGSYWAEQSLPGVGEGDTLALRFRARFDSRVTLGAAAQSFQTLATISDERGANWNVNVVVFPEGIYFNTGYFVPEDLSGGSSAPNPHEPEVWHCVELILTEDAAAPMQLFVNGEQLVRLEDPAAGSHGVGFSLSLGARWLQGIEFAPGITVADVAVADAAIGC